MAFIDLRDRLSAAWLKSEFLFGVDLTDDNGDPYPDSMYEASILQAVQDVEAALEIMLTFTTIEGERQDAYAPDRDGFFPVYLHQAPIRRVTHFGLQYGDFSDIDLPATWISLLYPRHGCLNIIPSGEEPGPSVFGQGVPLLVGSALNHVRNMPGYFRFTYEAGFPYYSDEVADVESGDQVAVVFDVPWIDANYDVAVEVRDSEGEAIGATWRVLAKSKTGFAVRPTFTPGEAVGPFSMAWAAETLPMAIRRAVGLRAASMPLNTAGDLIAGAGIANFSVGVDGLSQSVGTTSSATNAGYGARLIRYDKEFKDLIASLQKIWTPPKMAMI